MAAEALTVAASANNGGDEVTLVPTNAIGKFVIAVYPFDAIERGDLSLIKGEEYEVLDDSQDHWWQVRNKHGEEGFIPSNYVKEKDALGLQSFDW